MRSTCRIVDGWIPLPLDALAATGWSDGDVIELDVVEGVILVTRVDPQPVRAARVAPAKRRSLIKETP